MCQGHIQITICQCDAGEVLADMAHFGIGGFEELTPGRQFIEKVSDLDCGAEICAAWAGAAFISAINLNTIGLSFGLCPTHGPDLRHRSNTCQCFASKAKRCDAPQVGARFDFAGAV